MLEWQLSLRNNRLAILAIDHVQLAAPAGAEEVARRFYGELLEMQELEKPEILRARGGVWFQCGTQQLHIGIQSDFAPATKAHPAFQVNDLGVLRQRLEAANVAIVEDHPLEGIQRFHVADPFGNRLEFLQYDRGSTAT